MTTPQSPPPAVPARDRNTLYAVLGLIGAVCCPILGIIFGFLGLAEARRTGKSPTLAYLAVALSILSALTGALLTANGTIRVNS